MLQFDYNPRAEEVATEIGLTTGQANKPDCLVSGQWEILLKWDVQHFWNFWNDIKGASHKQTRTHIYQH